jgi:hypothetical protein
MFGVRLLALALALAPLGAAAQSWTRAAGGPGADAGAGIAALADGGFLAAGYSASFAPGQQAYVVRTDALGDTLWTRVLDAGAYSERAYDVVPVEDGGAIVVGVAYLPAPVFAFRPWLVRLDADGGVVYSTESGLSREIPVVSGVVRGALRADGALVIAGGNNSLSAPQSPWIAVVNPADGSLRSFRSLSPLLGGFGSGTYVDAVQATPDGGVVLGGQAASGTGEAFLWKFDADADSSWVRFYRAQGLRTAFSTRVAPDGGFVLAGCSLPNCDDAQVVRTNADGIPVWSRTYPDTLYTQARDAAPLDDGGVLVLRARIDAVGTQSFDTDLVEVDADGAFVGATLFPGGASDPGGEGSVRLDRLVPYGGGGWFTAVGQRAAPGRLSDTDLYIVRDVSNLRSVSTAGRPETPVLRAGPNPASTSLRLTGAARIDRAEIVDALGRRVAAPFDGAAFDLRGLAPGAYVVRAETGGQAVTLRIVVVR